MKPPITNAEVDDVRRLLATCDGSLLDLVAHKPRVHPDSLKKLIPLMLTRAQALRAEAGLEPKKVGPQAVRRMVNRGLVCSGYPPVSLEQVQQVLAHVRPELIGQ